MTFGSDRSSIVTSRRALLGTVGSLAVSLAGCSALPGFSASLDGDRLAALVDDTDRPTVSHGLGLSVTDEYRRASARRVEMLLEPIPEPIGTETVPNGVIRRRLESNREDAREHANAAADEPTIGARLERLRLARRSAADAAGIWAAIDEGRTRSEILEATDAQRTSLESFDEERVFLVGSDPIAAVWTHADVASLLDTAADELASVSDVDEPAPSLAVGAMAARLEAGRAAFEDASHVYETLVDSLEDAERAALSEAAASLADRRSDRREVLPDPLSADPHEYVDRDIEPESTSATVLEFALYEIEAAGDDIPVGEPARYVRDAARNLVAIEGFERLRSRIETGDPIVIETVDDVADRRNDAITAIESLLEAGALERWVASNLCERLERADQLLREATGQSVELNAVRTPVALYCLTAGMARATPDIVAVLREVLS
ncbi:hypothetical protein C478_09394 [Natrinema thermotolerans DSM 11552]|nr:hypothetical protein C478_09394 [Natrinema thermotolerans DSM 11552]